MSDTIIKDEAAVAPTVNDVQMDETPAVVKTEAVEISTEAPAAVEAPEATTKEETIKEEAAKEAEPAQDGATKPAPMIKTRNQVDREDYKKNRKYDATVLPVTDDPNLIRAQVEFYFGDSNLPMDKFMWDTTGGEENKPVSLKTICAFKRMQRFQPYSAVVAALKESKLLVVEGEDGEEVIKRKVAYVSSTDAQKARTARSVYVKGFGDELPTTQFDVESFFRNYGVVNHLKMRRTKENLFKGSVFVEFSSEEEADKFIKLDPAPTWKDAELKIMKKQDYLNEKTALIKAGVIEPSTGGRPTFYEGQIKGGRDGRGRGGNFHGNKDRKEGDSENWKKRRDDDQKNGFRGGRGGRGRGGRGGRGRGGRGGRGGRDDRGDNRRDDDGRPRSNNDVKPPTIQATTESGAPVNGTKRAREDDGGASAPSAKKADTKVAGEQ
ncbi:hypothetical protein B0T17DRAFT_504662 [Bombardia bombarda]|uniref:La domain-containing protein n=1 Tax=Bombardia bombarda TaxID=252184 RepID=A0AA40CGF8_9PEZI|nr:hypothetical protein B0T17DRAFT_504662 [Bombardia bombarda]